MSRPAAEWRWLALPVAFVLLLYWRAPLLGFAGDDALVLYHLKRLGGLAHAAAFFSSLDFFTYYRPLGFVSFAVDAAAWAWRPAGFHVTNVLLHALNAALVFAVGRRLMSAPWATLAAVLFAAHASNQEAVYWVSARFDLLATAGVLATLLLATRRGVPGPLLAMVTFALALLSKEAALAAPLLVGAYEVFIRRSSPVRVIAILAGMLLVVGIYAASRSLVGGLDPTGGASRLPKAAMLAAGTCLLMVLSWTGWGWLGRAADRARTMPTMVVLVILLGALAAASVLPGAGAPVREKLSFAGFAAFYLLSPVVAPPSPPYFLDPATPVYWVGGLAVIAALAALLFASRARWSRDDRWLFIAVATAGALLPVSSLMEGQRYLYLGSVPVSLGLARLVADAPRGRRQNAVGIAVLALLAVSGWQVQVKGADWAWATGMLSRGAALVNQDLPACGEGDVVFLTAPVGVRGVYSHFYHQTFSQDGGCEPGSYRAVARMVRTDETVEVQWQGPRQLVIRAPAYARNFLLSSDLRVFDVQQRSRRTARLETPVGTLDSRPEGESQVLTLDLSPSLDLVRTRFYYFSDGEIRRLARRAEPPSDHQ